MNQLFALTNIAATLALLMIAGVGVAAAGLYKGSHSPLELPSPKGKQIK